MSQQPTATIAGKMRLWGPETAGERKRRLVLVVLVLFTFPFIAGTAGILRELEALCDAFAIRDCAVLVLAGAFLRF